MSTTARDIGDQERLTVAFTDLNGTAVNPTTVTLKVRTPDGTVTTLATSDSPNPIGNASTGNYYYDYTYAQEGRHHFEWSASGALVAAASGERWVRRSNVT